MFNLKRKKEWKISYLYMLYLIYQFVIFPTFYTI